MEDPLNPIGIAGRLLQSLSPLTVLALVGCSSAEVVSPGPPGEPVASVQGCVDSDWESTGMDGLIARFPSAFAADGSKLGGFAEQALRNLDATFASYGGRDLISGFDIVLTMYAEPNRYANPGRMTLDIRQGEERRIAEIHVLAPSCHAVKGMTMIGAPYDDEYFFKVIAHEIGSLYMLGITEGKAAGWSLNDSPRWFNEGYQEYLGLTNSTAFTRDVIGQRYVDAVKKSPERVRVEMTADNPYLDGANVLRFLHETYGDLAVQALLDSERDNFWDAVLAEFGLTPERLLVSYREWLSRQ